MEIEKSGFVVAPLRLYLRDRHWGTVREDYSSGGTAWEYFGDDHALSRAYRWGEGGLAGLSDDEQGSAWRPRCGTAVTRF
jgi:hypothetical protein